MTFVTCHTSLYKCINLLLGVIVSRFFTNNSRQRTVNPTQTPDPWSKLYSARRHVIACATVIEDMLPILPQDVTHEVLDFGLHLDPNSLKQVLQDKINEASADVDVLLLGYGLCSMAVVGLTATTATLVIPRVDDCTAIFLGSCHAYQREHQKEPGTYYLTKGWIEVGDTPFDEHNLLVERYGKAKAERMTKLMLKNYTRLALINTGQYEIEKYREYSKKTAKTFDLRFEEIEGSSNMIEQMLTGPWDDDFVVIRPGESVKYAQFTRS